MAESNSLLGPHIAIIPSAGAGHLTPLLRFAATLVERQCQVTIITVQPTVSIAESQLVARFLSAYPQVTEKQFHLLPFDPSDVNTTNDPFWLRWEAINRSAHLLAPLLSTISPPLSALICDVPLIPSVVPVTKNISLPCYVFFPASSRMFAFVLAFPTTGAPKVWSGSIKSNDLNIEIPGLPPVPVSSMPPPLSDPNHLFSHSFKGVGATAPKCTGILMNSSEKLEPDTLEALKNGTIVADLPPVHAVGPLPPFEFEKSGSSDEPITWLDDQPPESVVFVCFGNRAPMSREQIRELGDGLSKSGYRFLWVVKVTKVDRDDEDDLDNILGPELVQKIEDKGYVVKSWIDQAKVLAHKAVGGFLSHSGWNSVAEAGLYGVPMLGWPQLGDQRVNGESMEYTGLGFWVRGWGWGGEGLVKGDEIGHKVKEMMETESYRVRAKKLQEELREAVSESGIREKTLKEVIYNWKNSKSFK